MIAISDMPGATQRSGYNLPERKTTFTQRVTNPSTAASGQYPSPTIWYTNQIVMASMIARATIRKMSDAILVGRAPEGACAPPGTVCVAAVIAYWPAMAVSTCCLCLIQGLLRLQLAIGDQGHCIAPCLPDRVHLGDVRHRVRRCAGGDKRLQVLVFNLCGNRSPGRYAWVYIEHSLHRLVGGDEFLQEGLRQQLVLAEGVDHPALHAGKGAARLRPGGDGGHGERHLGFTEGRPGSTGR